VPSANESRPIPRHLHDAAISSLQDRCSQAEQMLVALLNSIDPELLERHHFDYVAAVKELTS
jgi:hypothetical protein